MPGSRQADGEHKNLLPGIMWLMQIQDDVPLSAHSTMRLGGNAAHLVEVVSRDEVVEALKFADQQKLPAIMIGVGSNIVWSDKGFSGLVIVNKIAGYQLLEEDEENAYLTIGAGENWDSVVERAVRDGWSGIETLSLIPGNAGATPVQNVGAYGQEIADVLVSIEAYDRENKTFITFAGPDCGFGYRTSRFKTTDHGKFFITGITLHLTKTNPVPPFYPSLQAYLDQHNISSYTPQVIRDAVIAVRQAKLPDPAVVANNGSFFANPIVDKNKLIELQFKNQNIVYWETEDGRIKLSAAWLVEHAGFKDVHDSATGMATWPKQPLVLVNENAKTTRQLIEFRDRIMKTVKDKFGVELRQEPELLGDQ